MIRNAVAEDASTIAEFQIAMAMETESKTLDRDTVMAACAAVFEDEKKGFYLVGEADGKVVASLLITYEWSDWRNHMVWYIQSVFVIKEYRGQGFFKRMYQHVTEMAKAEGAKMIRLYVETNNEKAQKVYESLGMKQLPYFMYQAKL